MVMALKEKDFGETIDFVRGKIPAESLITISFVHGHGKQRKTVLRVAWPQVPHVGEYFEANLYGRYLIREVVWGVDECGRALAICELG